MKVEIDDDEEMFVLYIKEESKVCEDALKAVSQISNNIHLNFVDNNDNLPSFIKGVPTLICLPNKTMLQGSQIFNYIFSRLGI